MIFDTIENIFLIELFSYPGAFLRWLFLGRKKGVFLKDVVKEKGMRNFWVGFTILFPIQIFFLIYFDLLFVW